MSVKELTLSQENSELVSEEFVILYEMSIFVDAPDPITADWNVERAFGELGDGQARTWVVHDTYEAPENGGITPGVLGYVYRLNFGAITTATARISAAHTGIYGVSN